MNEQAMSLKIDHVTIAGSDLKTLEQVLARAELATDYGGPHSNGITHMSLLGFDDGSYIELISTLEPGQAAPWWDAHIQGNGGPCAWAVEAGDVAAEAARIAALGIPVRGPNTMTRQRPDGVLVEWDLAFVGDKQPGATLPFLIRDRTPRELPEGPRRVAADRAWRVRPSASVTATDLTGVAMVVLGVLNLECAVDLFRRVYGWPAPVTKDDVNFGRLAHFPGSPVSLAAPLHPNDFLAERLRHFDESPCAFLIGTKNLVAASNRLRLGTVSSWFDRQVFWFDEPRRHRILLGLIETQPQAKMSLP
jgi:hypothetical protein